MSFAVVLQSVLKGERRCPLFPMFSGTGIPIEALMTCTLFEID